MMLNPSACSGLRYSQSDDQELDGRLPCAECHKAKNLVPESGGRPTKVGEKVLQLQRMLPLARVVYCSATGEVQVEIHSLSPTRTGPPCLMQGLKSMLRLGAYWHERG